LKRRETATEARQPGLSRRDKEGKRQNRALRSGRCPGWRGRVDLSEACFNQYNVAVSPPSSAFSDADFARVMARKFEQVRFLIVGDDARKIQSQFAEAKREAVACSTDELVSNLSHQAATAHFETTVWFYPSER